jgi:hypothetical protein
VVFAALMRASVIATLVVAIAAPAGRGHERLRLSFGPHSVSDHVLSRDGKYYAVNNARDQISIWSVPDFRIVRQIEFDQWVRRIDFAENGSELVIFVCAPNTPGGTLRWYDFHKDHFTKELNVPGFVCLLQQDIAAVLIHHKGRAPRDQAERDSIAVSVFDPRQGKDYPIPTTAGKLARPTRNKKLYALDISADGKHVAWVEDGGRTFVSDFRAGKIVWEHDTHEDARDVTFVDGGKRLVTYPTFMMWETATGKKILESRALCRVVTPDGQCCVYRLNDDWIFTDLERRKKAQFTFYPGSWQCHLLAFTPDQKLMSQFHLTGNLMLFRTGNRTDLTFGMGTTAFFHGYTLGVEHDLCFAHVETGAVVNLQGGALDAPGTRDGTINEDE